MAVLAGWLIATGAWAQQTGSGSDIHEEQGGFVVIEDSTTPPPPPKPLTVPASTSPLVGAEGKTPSYKPGSAVYAIPWAKHGSAPTEAKAAPAATRNAAASSPVSGEIGLKHEPSLMPSPKPISLPPPSWQARVGSTLRESMQAWATRAGWTLRWEASGIDYPIVAPLHFTGTYVSAASAVISAYAHADRPLWVCLYTAQQQHLTRVTDTPCRAGVAP